MKVLIPSYAAGSIIGKGGQTIVQLQKETGATIKLSKSKDFYPGNESRPVLLHTQNISHYQIFIFIFIYIYFLKITKLYIFSNSLKQSCTLVAIVKRDNYTIMQFPLKFLKFLSACAWNGAVMGLLD